MQYYSIFWLAWVEALQCAHSRPGSSNEWAWVESILVRNLAAENNMNAFAKRLTVYRKNLILQDIQLT
jgi:hypothetical protein